MEHDQAGGHATYVKLLTKPGEAWERIKADALSLAESFEAVGSAFADLLPSNPDWDFEDRITYISNVGDHERGN